MLFRFSKKRRAYHESYIRSDELALAMFMKVVPLISRQSMELEKTGQTDLSMRYFSKSGRDLFVGLKSHTSPSFKVILLPYSELKM